MKLEPFRMGESGGARSLSPLSPHPLRTLAPLSPHPRGAGKREGGGDWQRGRTAAGAAPCQGSGVGSVAWGVGVWVVGFRVEGLGFRV